MGRGSLRPASHAGGHWFDPSHAHVVGEPFEGSAVVYLDLRGHGRSEWGGPADWSFEVCADDVRAFCDALGIARPVVYGHSLGGFVAMVYGARHPGHPGALVLQSTYARFDLSRIIEAFRRAGGDEVAEIVDALPDRTAQLEVIERAGHFTWKDAPDRYWPLVTDFVTTTTGTNPPGLGSDPDAADGS